LFELSWQQQPGSPLHSTRHAWAGNFSVQLLGDGLFPLLPTDLWPPPDTLPHENGYPTAYYATVPDLARASAAAIEVILDRSPNGLQCETKEKPTKMNISIKTTVLFLAANPDGGTRLALDQESRSIREKIRSSDFPNALEFKTEWAVRPDDLLQYLNEYRPHVVHFSGHGSTSEELILHNELDQAKPVSKAALRAVFIALKDNIRVVILNACYSRPQAETIAEVIDCVVGMNQAIGDQAAIKFAASFYRAVGFGRSVQDAFDQGRAALMLEGLPEENTPELLVRAGVNPQTVFLINP